MSTAVWRFRRMERAELNANPVEGEFFTPQGITEALVREAIQNSLDARLPEALDPVRVRFAYSGPQGLSAESAEPYLRGLRPHLAAQADLDELPASEAPVPFVTIEDFGTRGLAGDPNQTEDRDGSDGPKNHFYYFWRNIGRSAKEQQDLGRWGLGKTVFPASSTINTFFGLTRRHDDGRALLMGQSVLTVHKIGNARCYPYGYYARHEDSDGFPAAIEDPSLIGTFCSDFDLKRAGASGLSIVVPFPEEELDLDGVVRSVIVQYFYPIIAGRLRVDIEAPGKQTQIDSLTIDAVTGAIHGDRRFNPDSLRQLYSLARWAQSLPPDERVLLEPAGTSGAPSWSESLFPATSLVSLQRRFEQGERLAVRAFVPVQMKRQAAVRSAVDVFLQRDDSLDHSEEHYVRQGITITGIRLVRDRGVRALLVVEHPQLSSLLGDSENPSHTDWLERRPIVRRRYERGASSIRFVRGALRELVRLLARPPEGREENLLSDIFYLDLEEKAHPGTSAGRRAGRRRRRTPPPPPQFPRPREQPFRLEREAGGFQIVGNPSANVSPAEIVVRAAYGVRRGDAFKAYNPLDFRLDRQPIQLDLERAGVEQVADNRIVLRVERPDFRVRICGFDPHRDLVVSARGRGPAT